MTALSRKTIAAVILVGSVFFLPAAGTAQDPGNTGSRILSTDSWSYEALEQLMARGHLPDLNPLSQPYRRIDVAWAMRNLNGEELPSPVARWVELLKRELAPEFARLSGEGLQGQDAGLELVLGGSGADSRRRDPLFPYRTEGEDGTEDQAWWRYSGSFWLETHNVAAEARLAKDAWTREEDGDPDGKNPGGFKQLGRTDNAYLTAAFGWGNLWVGRFRRNWGPMGQTGLMIGSNPTSYPQIGVDLGRGRFSFQFMAGELKSVAGRRRYVVANRLDYAWPNFKVSVGEAAVYSGEGSTLRLINPVEFIFFDHNANNDSEDISGNVMVNAMFWGRLGNATLYGEAALDDFDLNPRTGADDRPVEATSYQVSLGARYHGLRAGIVPDLDYRRVSGWSYRTGPEAEQWTHLDRGLGDPWSDYERLTLRVDLFPPIPGLRLSPIVQYQKAGEGDYRVPFPPRDEMLGAPGIFQGVVETTSRVGLQGHYQPGRIFFLDFDVGQSFIDNAGHEEGVTEDRFSYLLELGVTLILGLEGR